MKNEEMVQLKDAYEVVKGALGLHDLTREEELNNDILMKALCGFYNNLKKEYKLYSDEDDVYVYCGKTSEPEHLLIGLSGEIISIKKDSEFEEFKKNNAVLFSELDFKRDSIAFRTLVYPSILFDFQLEAFKKDDEDKAKLYIMRKYYKMNDKKSLEKNIIKKNIR